MKLSEEVVAILDNVCAKFGVAVDWTSENVVPYLTELAGKCVKYELVTSIMWIAAFALLTLACFAGAFKCYKVYHKAEDCDVKEGVSWLGIGLMVSGVILFCLSLLVALVQTHDIIACLTFPEKIILTFVKGLRV